MDWFRRRADAPRLAADELPTEIVRPPPRPPTLPEWVLAGARATLDGSTLVPVLNFLAFGTLAREAGLSFGEMLIVGAGVWWMSAQVVLAHGIAQGAMLAPTALSVLLASIPLLPMVVSVLPLFGARDRRRFALPIAQAISTVPWSMAQQRLPLLPEAARLPFFSGYAMAFMTFSLAAGAIGHQAAAALPPLVTALLVFILPMHLLFNAAGSARSATPWLAIAIGAVAAPLLEPVLKDFTLIGVGLVGGTLAFATVRLWRRILPPEVP
ncbi:AzlC family ABC transporter permease [Prosthecodimorpha staleyi]|uniref:AzlC family ABC transporter permease n=1 Tax=Prosthecodimorpha staleyi TaxID=2840188 RepID=A0A947GJS2_9HYPH|nr:AzlC family ABC transporter permease [Prosthecodimorpha staleyi]MBT9292279.1 AzlC family ABC transporter permease [Prosthecodimorpha staleyi]